KVRINPGNIGSEENVKKVIDAAKARRIPIRVGVNSGSLEKDIVARDGGVTAAGLAESALRNVAILEKYDFDDIVISLKSSDVKMNYDAYKIVHDKSNYPLHIGVTEAGTPSRGKIKSAAGIGALLLEGIGDTLRVSLTADPVEEVHFAKELLTALGMRKEGIEIVSCPTCGRTEVDLEKIAGAVERRAAELNAKGAHDLKIAVMGCAVNGPGEAKGADLGVACGKGKGLLFMNGEIVKSVKEEDIADELMKMAEEYAKNTGKLD
ncbi:MAG: (E)-4-hydroxy-3-methylbut-2-enyl-diphosphate synthase, partial [Firmicutes bacterium]|nr:(E)-4-hydroxy-3-methylbut-2-enyl-diphosphate synthase [Bacillota bacterium]